MKERIISKRADNTEEDRTEQEMRAARKTERLNEENQIAITILSDVKNISGEKILYNYSRDISSSGTKIQGNVLLPIDTFLKIDLILKNSKEKVTVFGKVKRNKVLTEGKSYEAGVEFVDTAPEAIKKLADYILSVNQYKSLNQIGLPYWIFDKFNKPKS